MKENINLFINDLVADFIDDKLSNSDIQDIIEGYCISNDLDYEVIYKMFRLSLENSER